jgi:Ca2+-binding RTX toxin-like protein
MRGELGDDTFVYAAGDFASGEAIDGDAGNDRILLQAGNTNLQTSTVTSIEIIEFDAAVAGPKIVRFAGSQIGGGVDSNASVISVAGAPDQLRINMLADTNLNLSGLTFVNWNDLAPENDRVRVFGDGDAESVTGSSVRDDIFGLGGDDVLTGGGGVDRLQGGLGDDIYFVDANGEVRELANQGIDQVFSTVSYALKPNIETLALQGVGNINGVGNASANVITGNIGSNTLNGAAGNDTLEGAAGVDRFVFNSILNVVNNVDTIVDMTVGVDQIRLENGIFTGLAAGVLSAAAFHIGAAAADASDRIIYNDVTGALIFDSNGSAAGGAKQFAALDIGLALSNTDFFVF